MPKTKHNIDYIEPGDYVTLTLCDGWYKVSHGRRVRESGSGFVLCSRYLLPSIFLSR